ncbi:MAG: LamG domain-containing protein [Deltaproteobacteria bacterium]|nr:LamG domain-containing protein [Deltaproteobacteria bacterium]
MADARNPIVRRGCYRPREVEGAHNLLAVSLLLSGCSSASVFTCQEDSQCTQPALRGTCEINGYCSFPDLGCSSGRRYGELAGDDQAGECVATTQDDSTSSGPGIFMTSSGGDPTVGVSGPEPTTSTTGSGMSSDSSGEVGSSTGSEVSVPTDGLVLWYGFEDLARTPGTADLSGNGLNATCAPRLCPISVPGPVGLAARFNGLDQFLALPDQRVLRFPRGFSASLWLWLDEHVGQARIAWGKSYESSGANSYEIYTASNDSLRFNMDAGTSGTVTMPELFPLRQWIHAVGTYDGDRMMLYVDGTVVAENEGVPPPQYDDHAMTVGSDIVGDSSSNHWPGAVDEVLVYDRALTQEEVLQLYARGMAAP